MSNAVGRDLDLFIAKVPKANLSISRPLGFINPSDFFGVTEL
jgi:hypothetical protein